MIGYCCGCGRQVVIYDKDLKHGEAERYNINKCGCGSRTAALERFQNRPVVQFKRPDLRRRTNSLLRTMKRGGM